jgi:hypothetical protein
MSATFRIISALLCAVAGTALTLSLVAAEGFPLWDADGVEICIADEEQGNLFNDEAGLAITSDGFGGAILAWEDEWGDTETDIYAQRVDGDGNTLWSSNGVRICRHSNEQAEPDIAPDGSGGAFVVWKDYRSGSEIDIYAQRVDASGNARWRTDGVTVCVAANSQDMPRLVLDDSGGAIVVWRDDRNNSTTGYDIYAQRLDADGNALWTSDGVIICTAPYAQDYPRLTSDGAGGAIVTWHDDRTWSTYDIFAQRVYSTGIVAWTSTYPVTSGIPICTDTSGDQMYPQITSDGAGGAIIVWQDYLPPNGWDIWAQKVDANGNGWASFCGVSLCSDSADQESPQIAPDGAGGAIVAWADDRNIATGWDIYGQRVQSNGNTDWTLDGIGLCVHTSGQRYHQITSDGAGGAVVAWEDNRVTGSDIYAQRVDSSGNIKWGAGGLKVCGAKNSQAHPQVAYSGLRGAIVGWKDDRNDGTSDTDIYAQRMVDPAADVVLPLVLRYPF